MKRALILLFVAIPIALGLYARFDDLSTWKRYPRRFYLQGKPLFTCYDAFYFARWAKELKEGKYRWFGANDTLRYVPDTAKYPPVVPLLSFMAATYSRITGKSIEDFALWVSPLLAVLFVVPFVLYMQELNLPSAGLIGGISGATAMIYVARTSVGRLDTDSLNLFFPFMLAYLMLKYAKAKEKRSRVAYMVAIGAASNLYWWWYFHSGLIVGMLITLVLYLLLEGFPAGTKETVERLKKELPLLILLCNPYVIFTGVKAFVIRAVSFASKYLAPSAPTGFPNVVKSISEFKKFDFAQVAGMTVGSREMMVVCLIALALFSLKRTKSLVLLSIPLAIGLLTFISGNRFAMYLAPFLGAGIGFVLDDLMEAAKTRRTLRLKREWLYDALRVFLAIAISAPIILDNTKQAKAFTAFPKASPAMATEFMSLPKGTPIPWIWTWWDYGYAITYYSGDGVFHDGGSQTTPKTYLVATTFSTSDPKVAHNVILGVSNVGAKWISKAVKAGNATAREIAENFMNGKYNAPLKHPVFWAFTQDLVGKFTWINYFGTWNFGAKKGAWRGIFPGGICFPKGGVIICSRYRIDVKKGLLLLPGRAVLVKRLVIKRGDALTERRLNENGLTVEVVEVKGKLLSYAMEDQPYLSMFNQMYILRRYDKRYFQLVKDHFPVMVLYRVLP